MKKTTFVTALTPKAALELCDGVPDGVEEAINSVNQRLMKMPWYSLKGKPFFDFRFKKLDLTEKQIQAVSARLTLAGWPNVVVTQTGSHLSVFFDNANFEGTLYNSRRASITSVLTERQNSQTYSPIDPLIKHTPNNPFYQPVVTYFENRPADGLL